MKKDIQSIVDIKLMVDVFYSKVQQDDMLGPIFRSRIPNDGWAPHLATMYSFWQSILLAGEPTYRGAPFAAHINLPIDGMHFEKWLALFTQTVDENFSGEIANEAKSRAQSIAAVFQNKLSQIRKFRSET
jgi:hemoglobin